MSVGLGVERYVIGGNKKLTFGSMQREMLESLALLRAPALVICDDAETYELIELKAMPVTIACRAKDAPMFSDEGPRQWSDATRCSHVLLCTIPLTNIHSMVDARLHWQRMRQHRIVRGKSGSCQSS